MIHVTDIVLCVIQKKHVSKMAITVCIKIGSGRHCIRINLIITNLILVIGQ
jgi:hypothetical protein